MQDDRHRVHVVEIIPPGADRQQGQGAEGFSRAMPPGVKPLPPMLRTAILVAAVAAGLGLLALLVAFAATIALVAIPAALVAGVAAWAGMRWRAWRGSRAK
jgi:hypothetical protein